VAGTALLIGIAGALAAVTPLYLSVLALASLLPARRLPAASPEPDLTVLVPAHNEVELIGRTIRSLRQQTYSANHYRVVVVADNCTDATAAVAAEEGADVLVRSDPDRRGKGYALRWAMDAILGAEHAPQAVIVVDADSVAAPDFVAAMAAAFAAGHQSVQADDLLSTDRPSPRTELEGLALLLRNRIRFAGRASLGMPASLCGNGMLIAASVLRAQPWSAFTGTEDGEYAMILREAGVPTYFAEAAKVYASPTSGGLGAYTQGVRWDRGRFETARTWVPRLVAAAIRRREPGLLTSVIDELMLPLSASVAVLLAGTVAGLVAIRLGLMSPVYLVPWLVGLVAVPFYVAVALLSARVPARALLAVAALPYFVWLKVRVYARLLTGAESGWVRTQRPAEKRAQG
jgi:hypothetical protein